SQPEGIQRLEALAEVFVSRAKDLQNKGANIVIIAVPVEAFPLFGKADDEENDEDEPEASHEVEPAVATEKNIAPGLAKGKPPKVPYFHDILKACAMQQGVVIQMIRPSTYDDSMKRRETDTYGRRRHLQ